MKTAHGTKTIPIAARKPAAATKQEKIDGAVLNIARVADQTYAVTTDGVFAVNDPTTAWSKVEGPAGEPWRFLASKDATVLLASFKSLTLSNDSGKSWRTVPLPSQLTQVGAVAVDGNDGLWVGGREGVFLSPDKGQTWTTLKNLFVSDVNNIFYDPGGDRLLITANGAATIAFSLHLPDKAVKYWDTGWNLRFMRPEGDHLIGVTRFDGVVVQPQMVQSKEMASH